MRPSRSGTIAIGSGPRRYLKNQRSVICRELPEIIYRAPGGKVLSRKRLNGPAFGARVPETGRISLGSVILALPMTARQGLWTQRRGIAEKLPCAEEADLGA
jgi:hypothetical protein